MAELKIVQSVEEPIKPKFSNDKVIYGGVGASILLALCLSLYWFVYSNRIVSTDNAYIEADITPVNAHIMGFVKEVLVNEGDPVVKDQVIGSLDDTDFKVELNFKQAKFDKVSRDKDRAEILAKAHAISQSDFEGANALYAATKADLDGTLLKIQYTKIKSLINGTIGKKSIVSGQYVQPGQSLFVVVPNYGYFIKANFKETDIRKIKSGQKVKIYIDAYPSQTFNGTVDKIFPSSGAKLSLLPPENATGNFTKIVQKVPVRIKIDPVEGFDLKPGLSVTIKVDIHS